MRGWVTPLWCLVRDVALFSAGLALLIHEGLSANVSVDRLVIYAGMMGLPGVLRTDESRNEQSKSK